MSSGRASHKGSSTKPNLNTNGIVNADPDNSIACPDSQNNSGNRVPLRQKGTELTEVFLTWIVIASEVVEIDSSRGIGMTKGLDSQNSNRIPSCSLKSNVFISVIGNTRGVAAFFQKLIGG
jgi:hypothetical protein